MIFLAVDVSSRLPLLSVLVDNSHTVVEIHRRPSPSTPVCPWIEPVTLAFKIHGHLQCSCGWIQYLDIHSVHVGGFCIRIYAVFMWVDPTSGHLRYSCVQIQWLYIYGTWPFSRHELHWVYVVIPICVEKSAVDRWCSGYHARRFLLLTIFSGT